MSRFITRTGLAVWKTIPCIMTTVLILMTPRIARMYIGLNGMTPITIADMLFLLFMPMTEYCL